MFHQLLSHQRRVPVLIFLLLLLLCYHTSLSFSPELSRRLPGIWKLRTESLPYAPDIRSRLQRLLAGGNNQKQNANIDVEILLKLNPDGTFKQCNEGYKEGKWISGIWRLMDDSSSSNGTKVVLAMNRQYFGPQFDLVLEGCLRYYDDGGQTVNGNAEPGGKTNRPLALLGNVQKGKYLHPRGHPSFFDPPFLANREIVGPFHMEQSLSTYSILGERRDSMESESSASKIQSSDFWEKKFILTIEPLLQSKKIKEQTRNEPVDIRSMPVTFFSNNTFSAMGVNKILRGRFQVQTSSEGDYELSMQVSLFGAGRSAPGSVYSEGLGLSHEDKRTYIGTIQEQFIPLDDGRSQKRMFYVQGIIFFGTDLGEDARPEPVARFYLSEDALETPTTDQMNAPVLNDIVSSREDDNDDSSPRSATGGIFE
ncbi:hypothetical protein IV203_011765 [Nitzschia inconspicua]|uniref:Uncharacterized protein n=1 Tax=Nitzschia inconspicua TaxID=303405 RepID=A0A9K3PIZ1_9STRA|nr:hypothetical protein IV203_011765 [Nitzschia inconspicua]